MMIEPVSYETVRRVGFYRQFLSTRDWAEFMRAGGSRHAGCWRQPGPVGSPQRRPNQPASANTSSKPATRAS